MKTKLIRKGKQTSSLAHGSRADAARKRNIDREADKDREKINTI